MGKSIELNGILYTRLPRKHKYRYRLDRAYQIQTDIRLVRPIDVEYISISKNGLMTIRKNYCWNGADKPAINTKSIVRGSLCHDPICQLANMDLLTKKDRVIGDKLLRKVCLQDKMSRFRAWRVYWAVRIYTEVSSFFS